MVAGMGGSEIFLTILLTLVGECSLRPTSGLQWWILLFLQLRLITLSSCKIQRFQFVLIRPFLLSLTGSSHLVKLLKALQLLHLVCAGLHDPRLCPHLGLPGKISRGKKQKRIWIGKGFYLFFWCLLCFSSKEVYSSIKTMQPQLSGEHMFGRHMSGHFCPGQHLSGGTFVRVCKFWARDGHHMSAQALGLLGLGPRPDLIKQALHLLGQLR